MFKHRRTLTGALVLALGVALALAWAAGPDARANNNSTRALKPEAPLGTGFSYQGRLVSEGAPAAGPCDFRFSIFDADIGGAKVGSTLTRTDVELDDGRFAVILDFGVGIFTGDARWLEIAAQCAGEAEYTTLGRKALRATPYALYAADAGHLEGRDASTFADSAHDHLGEAWTGTDNPLKIEGSFGGLDNAPLVLRNSGGDGLRVYAATGGDGVRVYDASQIGVHVLAAGVDGVRVYSANDVGVKVEAAGDDGFQVCRTGDRTSCTVDDDHHHGLEVGNAQHDGVHVIEAVRDGLRVESAGGNGLRVNGAGLNNVELWDATYDGVQVWQAGRHGVNVYSADEVGVRVDAVGDDGFQVCRTGDRTSCTLDGAYHHGLEVGNAQHDGVHVESAGYYGLYVASSGLGGVHVFSDNDGVYANTEYASHEWGVYTPDKIYGSNVTSAGPLTFVAQNGDAKALEPGDVVAGIGLAAPFADAPDPIPLVGLADGQSGLGVIGVVLSRFVAEDEVEELETESGVERLTRFRTHSEEGPVAPGEHLLIVVVGVTHVKIDPGTQIEPGRRLTASEVAGTARALRTETLNGMVVTEGAPAVGVALAAPEPGQTTIPVFVTLR